MAQPAKESSKPLSLVWVVCPYLVMTAGLIRALEKQAQVHTGPAPPDDVPSCVILCANAHNDLAYGRRHYQELRPNAPPILIFASHQDLQLAQDALRAGASGFIHAEMTPKQLVRAVTMAMRGELVAPRELIGYLIARGDPVDLSVLSARQREILELVVEGLSNAEIAKRLYLSESTIKQHLRTAYKLLKVSNRTEAASLVRRGD